MQNALNQLRDWWSNAPRPMRIGILGGVAGLLVLFLALGFWASTPSYTTLYTGLSPADSAAVVQTLKEKGIRVRTSGGGSVVEVESGRAEEARLELAAKGLPKTGAPGYARLEKTPFGLTQAMEQTTLRVALEEELQNTIQHLEPVESARVHITPGQRLALRRFAHRTERQRGGEPQADHNPHPRADTRYRASGVPQCGGIETRAGHGGGWRGTPALERQRHHGTRQRTHTRPARGGTHLCRRTATPTPARTGSRAGTG
jgi:hypothetical protein